MAGWLNRPGRARRRVAAALLVAGGLLAAAGLFGVGRSAVFQARLFAVEGARGFGSGIGPAQATQIHFRFRGRTRFVNILVDPAELATARELDTSCVFSTVGLVRAANLKALVSSQVRSRTVDGLALELRRIRAELGLDDDDYVDLIARFVQSIPYGVPDTRVHLPVEVIAAGDGVCDDKSVLLAALLLHEGYDTAIWTFDAQAHAAVGVKCSGPGTFGSGYALVETTRIAFVGDVTGSLGSRASWRRSPQLVRLGGSRRYGADHEAAYLAKLLRDSRSTVRSLHPYARALASGPEHWRPAYEQADRRRRAAEQLAMLVAVSMDDRHRLYDELSAANVR